MTATTFGRGVMPDESEGSAPMSAHLPGAKPPMSMYPSATATDPAFSGKNDAVADGYIDIGDRVILAGEGRVGRAIARDSSCRLVDLLDHIGYATLGQGTTGGIDYMDVQSTGPGILRGDGRLLGRFFRGG